MSAGFNLDEYVDVAERIRMFSEKHPEGTLQSEVQFVDGGVLCKAFAYRGPEDERPGIGHAFEPIPGKTPYTRDSEVMNAETSAWGRAIVALGFETKKIASRQEVRNRSGAGSTATARENAVGSDEAGSTDTAPDNPAAAAQAAAEAAKAARTPTDNGDPRNVILTFGKHKNTNLGAVPSAYLEWLIGNFEAKTAEQRRILAAAQAVLAGDYPDEELPFA